MNISLNPLYRKVSIYITRLLLHTPISANQVTVFSILLGILGSSLLSVGEFQYLIAGSLLLMLFDVLDAVDGEIARFRGTDSYLKGQYLEWLSHFVLNIVTIWGLSVAVYRSLGQSSFLLIGHVAVLSEVFQSCLRESAYRTLANYCYKLKQTDLGRQVDKKRIPCKTKEGNSLKGSKKPAIHQLSLLDVGRSFYYFFYTLSLWIMIASLLDKFSNRILLDLIGVSALGLLLVVQAVGRFGILIIRIYIFLFSDTLESSRLRLQ